MDNNKLLCKKLFEILEISNDNYIFNLDDLENNDKKSKILDFERFILDKNALNKNLEYKRRYFALIKYIIKQNGYQLINSYKNIRKEDGSLKKTKTYTIVPINYNIKIK